MAALLHLQTDVCLKRDLNEIFGRHNLAPSTYGSASAFITPLVAIGVALPAPHHPAPVNSAVL